MVGVKEKEKDENELGKLLRGINSLQSSEGPFKEWGDESSCARWQSDSTGAKQC